MAQSAVHPSYAYLLAIVFVGGFALPDADALLYHSGAPHAEIPHFDRPGGCGTHAEHCVLAVTSSLRRLASALTTLPELDHAEARAVCLSPTTAPRPTGRINLQPTRAPPAAS
ncbi:MAG: hypothetical protein ABIY46_09035 [Gemmatimonadales bacterium]